MGMKKRVLASLLVVSMIVSLPVTAKAQECVGGSSDVLESNENIVGSESLQEGDAADKAISVDEDFTEEQSLGDDAEAVNNTDDTTENEEVQAVSDVDKEMALTYRVHVQSIGWQDAKNGGAVAGTTGLGKRLEAIQLEVGDSSYEGSIQYRTHVQSHGWLSWVSDGETSGTTGQGKRLEAIQIRLTGELAEHYDVYYRVHAQSYGWLGWACNGGGAGTSTYGKRLEAIQVVLVEKGDAAPGNTANAYYAPRVQYQTHVQSYGWQAMKQDGATSGTAGASKRLEAIKITVPDPQMLGYGGGITYRTHVQSYGWQNWVSGGTISGTTGKAKRLEAIQIKLTGELADHYSVYYRVHSQTLGWLGWAKDGESAGTEGFSNDWKQLKLCW